jgi:hypothetical protein
VFSTWYRRKGRGKWAATPGFTGSGLTQRRHGQPRERRGQPLPWSRTCLGDIINDGVTELRHVLAPFFRQVKPQLRTVAAQNEAPVSLDEPRLPTVGAPRCDGIQAEAWFGCVERRLACAGKA